MSEDSLNTMGISDALNEIVQYLERTQQKDIPRPLGPTATYEEIKTTVNALLASMQRVAQETPPKEVQGDFGISQALKYLKGLSNRLGKGKIHGANGVVVHDFGDEITIGREPERKDGGQPHPGVFYARITGRTDYAYSWEEVIPDPTATQMTWTTIKNPDAADAGRTGSVTVDAAFERNASQSVPTGSVVELYDVRRSDGSAVYEFTFRVVGSPYFDGACVLVKADGEAASGSVDEMTVTAGATLGGSPGVAAIPGDNDKILLLHLSAPVAGPAVLLVEMGAEPYFELQDNSIPGPPHPFNEAICTINILHATEDFDWENTGAVTPQRNTYNDPPATMADAQIRTISAAVNQVDEWSDGTKTSKTTLRRGQGIVIGADQGGWGLVVQVPAGETCFGVGVQVELWHETNGPWDATTNCTSYFKAFVERSATRQL